MRIEDFSNFACRQLACAVNDCLQRRSPEVAIYLTEHQEALILEMQSFNELVPNVRDRMHVVYEFVVYACMAQWPTYVHIQ